MNNMSEEVWKDVVGYDGRYKVSSFGNVKTMNFNHTGQEKILSFREKKSRGGYLQVRLSLNGKKKSLLVHRLVALAFLENPKKLEQVNHKDENKKNNCVANLEWCDAKYNNSYGTRIERQKMKVSKPVQQFTLDDKLISEYKSAHEASRRTGIDRSSISACCRGKYGTMGTFRWRYRDDASCRLDGMTMKSPETPLKCVLGATGLLRV